MFHARLQEGASCLKGQGRTLPKAAERVGDKVIDLEGAARLNMGRRGLGAWGSRNVSAVAGAKPVESRALQALLSRPRPMQPRGGVQRTHCGSMRTSFQALGSLWWAAEAKARESTAGTAERGGLANLDVREGWQGCTLLGAAPCSTSTAMAGAARQSQQAEGARQRC